MKDDTLSNSNEEKYEFEAKLSAFVNHYKALTP